MLNTAKNTYLNILN